MRWRVPVSVLCSLFLCVLLPRGDGRAESRVGGNIAPDGREVQLDLPSSLHVKNRGGSDGAGLCVFASIKHASIWQEVFQTVGLFEWMFKHPGGGWPDKVDKMIAQICQEKGWKRPSYIQYQGNDLAIIRAACKTGRMPSVTYNYSPTGRYGGSKIAHMVSIVHADEKWVGVLDNNFPGTVEWMDPDTFLKVWTGGGRNGWAIVFLNPGPPPVPRNR